MTAARHSIMQEGVPYRFPFVAVKFISNRDRLNATVIDSPGWGVQVSVLEFCSAGNEMFSVPGASTVVSHMAYKGSHYVSNPPRSIDEVNYSEAFGRLFDGNTRTKLFRNGTNALEEITSNRRPGFFDVSDATFSDVIGFGKNTDYGDTLDAGETNESQARRLLGSDGFVGFTAVIALGDGASLDIQRFSKWRFYNANDNRSYQGRTWVWGEILGSADGRKWWTLDRFKDASITDANYALAYEGQLAVQGKGDLISDLDLNEWYS